jgi:hypothetical protein
MYINAIKSQSGLAALLAVVIVGASVLIIAKNASFMGIGEIDMAYLSAKGEEALTITEGCVEETLRRFQINPDYTADNFSLLIGEGECTIRTTANGNQRAITVLGRRENYFKKIQVNVILDNEQIVIDDWQELSE